ncbi:MAG: stage II sporulation protein M, partial [Planctomycetota bacterium]
ALHAGLLFAVGLFVAWPVVRYRLTGVAWLPRRIFRLVVRMMGPRPSLPRMAGVIFVFNSIVMFLQMVVGFHSFLPKVLAIWTGMNVGVMMGFAGESEGMIRRVARRTDGFIPPPALTLVCSLLVMLLELPAYFYALAMGMKLGHTVQGGDAAYLAALEPRAIAYVMFVVPTLFASALAESVSIRGAATGGVPPAQRGGEQEDGE